jgi:hypothetical protein
MSRKVGHVQRFATTAANCARENSNSSGSPKGNDFLTSVAGAAMTRSHSDSIWVPRAKWSGLTRAPPCWTGRVDEAGLCRVPFDSLSAAHVRSPRPTSPSMWSARSARCSGCPSLRTSLQNSFACCVPGGGRLSLIDTDWSTLLLDVGDAQITSMVREGCASNEAVRRATTRRTRYRRHR